MMRWILLVAVMTFMTGGLAAAEDGVSPTEIVLGQSAALTGPTELLGKGMQAGMNAYFAKKNGTGGVKNRKIRLVSLDDGYEPDRAIQNTRELIEKNRIFALIGEVGTPTSVAASPIAEKAGVPFLAPFTGAEAIRNPFRTNVFHIRASYNQETEKLAEYLADKKGLKKIACFYQNDTFGQAGLSGIRMALEKRGMSLVATGIFERNTLAVKGGLLDIRKGQPQAVVMIGPYKPCAEFVRTARKVGMADVVFCTVSFVGSEALAKDLGTEGEGVVISQVVPFPWDDASPLIKEYREAMGKFDPNAAVGFVSLEGYMAAMFFTMAVDAIPGEITRENLIKTIETVGVFDLGQTVMKFGPNDHQGMDEVFLTKITDGQIKRVDE